MKNQMNQTMEWMKLIAAWFVIFIHVRFPGNMGAVMNCLARFAVPFFFITSGYFSYHISDSSIRRRFLHILKLFLIAASVYFVWGICKAYFVTGKGILDFLSTSFSQKRMIRFFLTGDVSFGMHLWFLTSLMFCYAALWFYNHTGNRQSATCHSLYYTGLFLLFVNLLVQIILPLMDCKISVAYYRNGLLFGLPMFILGIFLREYQDRILTRLHWNIKKGIFLMVLGVFLGLLQWFCIGKYEMSIGALCTVLGLFLLVIQHPHITDSDTRSYRLAHTAGSMSLVIYLMHPMISYIIKGFQDQVWLFAVLVNHKYLYPFVILLLGSALALLFSAVWRSLRHSL